MIMYMRFVEWVDRTPIAQVALVVTIVVLSLIGGTLIDQLPS